MRGVYTAEISISSLSSAKTLMLLTAPSTACLEILSVSTSNLTSETSEQLSIGLFNVTTIGSPSGTAVTPEKHENLDAAASATASGNLSGEPSAYSSKGIDVQGVNSLSSYRYDPMPEERPIVGPSRAIGVRMLTAPTNSFDCRVQVVFREIG